MKKNKKKRWLVQKLVPSAEMVKFTSSGTEASLLAMKLARVFTGKDKIAKFTGHFHGWHDYSQVGQAPPFEVPPPGTPAAVVGTVVPLDPRDESGIEWVLESDDSVGAIILEPTGASWGTVPLRPGFLQWLRELTTRTSARLTADPF